MVFFLVSWRVDGPKAKVQSASFGYPWVALCLLSVQDFVTGRTLVRGQGSTNDVAAFISQRVMGTVRGMKEPVFCQYGVLRRSHVPGCSHGKCKQAWKLSFVPTVLLENLLRNTKLQADFLQPYRVRQCAFRAFDCWEENRGTLEDVRLGAQKLLSLTGYVTLWSVAISFR